MGKTLRGPIIRHNVGRRPEPARVAQVEPTAPSVARQAVHRTWTAVLTQTACVDLALSRCGNRPASFCLVDADVQIVRYLVARASPQLRVLVLNGRSRASHVFVSQLEREGLLKNVELASSMEDFQPESLDLILLCDGDAQPMGDWWRTLRSGGMLAGGRGGRDASDFAESSGHGHALRANNDTWWVLYKSIAVDATYCIRRSNDPDGRKTAEQQFARAGIQNVEFVPLGDGRLIPRSMGRGQTARVAGHTSVLDAARKRGAKHVLVFEDDVQLVDEFEAKFKSVLARCPAQYDVMQLGAICIEAWDNHLVRFDEPLSKAGNLAGVSAYLVNVAAAESIQAGLSPMKRSVDEYFAKEVHPTGHAYCCTPYVASSAGARSHGYIWRSG